MLRFRIFETGTAASRGVGWGAVAGPRAAAIDRAVNGGGSCHVQAFPSAVSRPATVPTPLLWDWPPPLPDVLDF